MLYDALKGLGDDFFDIRVINVGAGDGIGEDGHTNSRNLRYSDTIEGRRNSVIIRRTNYLVKHSKIHYEQPKNQCRKHFCSGRK